MSRRFFLKGLAAMGLVAAIPAAESPAVELVGASIGLTPPFAVPSRLAILTVTGTKLAEMDVACERIDQGWRISGRDPAAEMSGAAARCLWTFPDGREIEGTVGVGRWFDLNSDYTSVIMGGSVTIEGTIRSLKRFQT